MRPEGGKAVGGAKSPGGQGRTRSHKQSRRSRIPANCSTDKENVGRQPSRQRGLLPSPYRSQKVVSAAGQNIPWPAQRSLVVTAAVTRSINLLDGVERSSMVIRGPCARKSRNFDEAKEGLPKPAVSGLGTSPIKPVLSPQALMRKIPPPSKGVRLLDPLRWYLSLIHISEPTRPY